MWVGLGPRLLLLLDCSVWELRHGEVVAWGIYGVGELRQRGVVVRENHGVCELPFAGVAV